MSLFAAIFSGVLWCSIETLRMASLVFSDTSRSELEHALEQ
jgi:hypothetical protein